MKLWFDQHRRTYLEFEKSLRCHTLRHEKDDGRGCTGWSRSPGTGRRICMCHCHGDAILRRPKASGRPPLDLRPYAGGVTMAEAGENLRAAFAAMSTFADTRIGRVALLSGLNAEEIEELGGIGEEASGG